MDEYHISEPKSSKNLAIDGKNWMNPSLTFNETLKKKNFERIWDFVSEWELGIFMNKNGYK